MSKPPPDPIFTLRGHTGSISNVHFSTEIFNGSQCLLSTSSLGEMFLWDLKNYRVQCKHNAHNKKSILWTDSLEGRIFSQGRDGNLSTWKIENGEFLQLCSRPHNSIGFCKCSLLKNESVLLACPTKNMSTVEILDVATMQVVMTTENLFKNNNQKYGMCMCCKLFTLPNTSCPLVICAFENGYLVLISLKDQCVLSETKVHNNSIMCLDMDGDFRQKCVTASVENEIVVTNCSNPKEINVVQTVSITNPGVNSLAIRGDGKIACSGGADHRIRIFSWKNMRSLAVLNYHSDQIQCTSFSKKTDFYDKYILAAGSMDKKISLWSLYDS